MSAWTSRIRSRMKELGITQDVLARKMGITRGAITHYLAGRRIPPLKQFQKVAAVLKVDPAWLQYGTTSSTTKTTEKTNKKVKNEKIISSKIPILTWEQAAELTDVTKIAANEIKEVIPSFYTNEPRWYALRIQGDSMVASQGQAKSFHAGDIIIIDPDKNAVHGDYVIALLPRSKEAIFKQYVIDGGTRYLKPLNPQYPLTQINDATHICGVVIRCLSVVN